MILPQHHVLLFFPAPAEPAEATVTVAVGMLLAVFLPQQLQRQVAVLFQLLAYIKVVLVHRALAGPDAARNLPLAEFLLEVQAQDLFDLSHGLSLSGQLRSALPRDHHRCLRLSPAPPFSSFSSDPDHRSPIPITSGQNRPRVIGFSGER